MCRPEKENQEYEPFNAIEFIISSASFWHLAEAEFGNVLKCVSVVDFMRKFPLYSSHTYGWLRVRFESWKFFFFRIKQNIINSKNTAKATTSTKKKHEIKID